LLPPPPRSWCYQRRSAAARLPAPSSPGSAPPPAAAAPPPTDLIGGSRAALQEHPTPARPTLRPRLPCKHLCCEWVSSAELSSSHGPHSPAMKLSLRALVRHLACIRQLSAILAAAIPHLSSTCPVRRPASTQARESFNPGMGNPSTQARGSFNPGMGNPSTQARESLSLSLQPRNGESFNPGMGIPSTQARGIPRRRAGGAGRPCARGAA
jgi:hypothetical protein